jgi:hypothetical protein
MEKSSEIILSSKGKRERRREEVDRFRWKNPVRFFSLRKGKGK